MSGFRREFKKNAYKGWVRMQASIRLVGPLKWGTCRHLSISNVGLFAASPSPRLEGDFPPPPIFFCLFAGPLFVEV